MTHAICIACGKDKFGALAGCKACSYRPLSGWEMAVSIILSDQKLDEKLLRAVSDGIKSAVVDDDFYPFNFDDKADEFIKSTFDDPSYRDAFTLVKKAKYGFFSKQMNWHICGPYGIRSQVVTRGVDFEKVKFDAAYKQYGGDIFFIEAFDKGEAKKHSVTKSEFYCMVDLMAFGERMPSVSSYQQEVLLMQAEHYTQEYLVSAQN